HTCRDLPRRLLLIEHDVYSRCLLVVLRRPSRHADGLFTSGYSKLLGQLSARRYLESLIGKRVSDELMDEPVKRHSDAIFTDNYSRFRKQMAVKKYLNSVLTGKRSLEDPVASDPEDSMDEPNTFQDSYSDINVDHLLNNFQLVGTNTQKKKVYSYSIVALINKMHSIDIKMYLNAPVKSFMLVMKLTESDTDVSL
uniref:Vasoactive intestinal peptide n=1 Tax=Labrus bergylta TaxID=56723 RepID=A0A3Q3LCW2_9LABR